MSGLYVKFSTGWPRKPEFRRAGPMARLIYVELAMFCKENLTDGAVDEANLADFAVDVPKKRTHMQTLVDVGALEKTPTGWRIPLDVWCKWNPTKAEVEAKKEEERQRKAKYRKDKQSGECPEDVPTGHDGMSQTCPTTPEPEPLPEPTPEAESEPSQPPHPTGSAWTPRTLAGAVGELYAKDQNNGSDVRNIDGLASWKANELLRDRMPALRYVCDRSREYQEITGNPISAFAAFRHIVGGSEFALENYTSVISRAQEVQP